jgi:hypothetical protein
VIASRSLCQDIDLSTPGPPDRVRGVAEPLQHSDHRIVDTARLYTYIVHPAESYQCLARTPEGPRPETDGGRRTTNGVTNSSRRTRRGPTEAEGDLTRGEVACSHDAMAHDRGTLEQPDVSTTSPKPSVRRQTRTRAVVVVVRSVSRPSRRAITPRRPVASSVHGARSSNGVPLDATQHIRQPSAHSSLYA